MIYLFCNETYGRPFLEAARRHREATGVPLTAVFSGKHEPPETAGSPVSRLRSRLRTRLRELRLGRDLGIPVRIVRDVNAPAFRERVAAGDHGVVSGFNQIFREETIRRFATLVNVHPSVLPWYRGPVPSYWCLRNGERKTGYTIHRVTGRIDDGEILYQEEVGIGDIADPDVLDARIARRGAARLGEYLEHLRTGAAWAAVRVDASRVYATKVDYASFPGKETENGGGDPPAGGRDARRG